LGIIVLGGIRFNYESEGITRTIIGKTPSRSFEACGRVVGKLEGDAVFARK